MPKYFLYKHEENDPTGFCFGARLCKHVYAVWLGYGKPVWWKPRLIGRGKSKYGFGFGWLLLCCRIQVFEV